MSMPGESKLARLSVPSHSAAIETLEYHGISVFSRDAEYQTAVLH